MSRETSGQFHFFKAYGWGIAAFVALIAVIAIFWDAGEGEEIAPKMVVAEPTLEELLDTPWEYLRVGAGYDSGDTGLMIYQEFTIQRNELEIEISGKETVSYGDYEETESRVMSSEDLERIIMRLKDHHGTAQKQLSEEEYYDAMPEPEREVEMEKWHEANGWSLPGFTGYYLYIGVAANGSKSSIVDGFENEFSYNDFSGWIRSVR